MSLMIEEEANIGNWRGMKLARDTDPLTCLFFVDDIIMFQCVEEKTINSIKSTIQDLYEMPSQRVSLHNSSVIFSMNISAS